MGIEVRPRARGDIETHTLPDGSCFVFDPVRCEGFALDVVEALVWDCCDGSLSRREIVREITAVVPQDDWARDRVDHALATFAQHDLLEPSGRSDEDGLSTVMDATARSASGGDV